MPNPESEFEWDDEKNLANDSKHGMRFEDAAGIFESDPLPEPPWDESKQVPDEEIDFSDIPEIESWEWKYARPMSHPEAFSKELRDAYDAEWRERQREKLGQAAEAKKP